VLGPCRVETVYPCVDSLQHGDLFARQLFSHSDGEVDIAMSIEVTNGEGALQVGTDKRIAQSIPNAGDQFFEDRIELRVRRPMIHRREGETGKVLNATLR
jgi:hypothetical protein